MRVKLDKSSGLILEGGGMRGVFTCGVLDNFMDRGIRFPYTIGVSAGACNGLSYMSSQRGRGKFSNIDMLEKYHYIGFKQLLTKGNIMDFELLFHTFPEKIVPYDYERYAQIEERYEMVTTSCLTGKACYYEEKNDPKRIIDIVKASSSLPFVCPVAYVDGEPMLDGGIADSIPLRRAQELGYDNNVVILTRNKGYRKPDKPTSIPPFFYRKYPALKEAIRRRNALYNEQISLVEELEDKGKLVVIRPQKPIEVDRMERDTRKLLDLYEEGYNVAAKVEFQAEVV
ncbi:MAG: patatin family protein [Alistipes sp.]|nr:patatin family protein [Alistipes sp.]